MSGLRLRDYQEIAADFLYEHDRAMILAPVGAGKTAITLRAMYDCLYNGVVTRWLVIAPKRVCTDVWPVEQPKWAPFMKLAVAVGTPKQRKEAFESKALVVVTNYDNLQSLPDDMDFDGIVFDELTRLKNPSGARFKALNKVINPIKIRWGLTGSFTSNGLEDVFGQCKIIDQQLLGRSKGAFMQKYFILMNKDFGEWAPRKGALPEVMQTIKPATFVLDLSLIHI
jgi:superfamily II DNA or RNA helicase